MKLLPDLAHVLAQLRACGYFGWHRPEVRLGRLTTKHRRTELLMDLLALEARRHILTTIQRPPTGPSRCWFCKKEHRYYGQQILAAEAQVWLNNHELLRLGLCRQCECGLMWDSTQRRFLCPACELEPWKEQMEKDLTPKQANV